MPTDNEKLLCATDSKLKKRDSHKISNGSSTAEPPSKRIKLQYDCRRKKGIRSLAPTQLNSPKKSHKNLKLFGIFIVILGFIMFWLKNEQFREELKHVAMNQFQLYLHGRENYCNEPFEHWQISNALHHRIIGQKAVLEKIDRVLQQHENISAMAFIGTQGIGKTLALNLIQENFQWHLNIQQYIWSLIKSSDDQLRNLMALINHLTKCGQNGIFIDDIPLKYIEIIKKFNRELLIYSNKNHIKLLVIYVFQTNNPIEANESIRMDNIKSINFRQFDSNDIWNCISMESERLKITISPAQIEELVDDIDAKRHGCKSIAARIARQETFE